MGVGNFEENHEKCELSGAPSSTTKWSSVLERTDPRLRASSAEKRAFFGLM